MNRSSPALRRILTALVFLALPALPALAGTGIWTSLGPDGAQVTALAVAPSDPDVVYAGTWLSGVFRSTDGGETWTFAGQGLGTSFVHAVAVDPARPDTVYVANGRGGVFKSTDGGGTWVHVWDGTLPDPPGGINAVFALAFDARRPGVVYAGTNSGVFRSTDGGATWRRRGNLPGVSALAVDSPGGWLFAGTGDKGVFKSGDQGKTWIPAGNGLPSSAVVRSLAIDPEQPRTLLAGTSLGIYRTHDRGRTWNPVVGALAREVSAVAFQNGGRAYAAFREFGVYRSGNGGFTWERALARSRDSLFLALAAGPVAVYTGDVNDAPRRGLVRSLDGGATWEPSMRGLSGLLIRPIAVDPSDPARLYAGGPGLFRSTDRGATWTRVDFGLRPEPSAVHDILIDPARPARVYVTANDGPLLRSDDRGATWERLSGGSVPVFLNDLAVDPRAPEALWATGTGLLGNGLFHSADGGETWQQVEGLPMDENFFALRVAVDPRDPRVVYLGAAQNVDGATGTRLFRSTDGGVTWERRDAGLANGSVSDIAFDAADPSTMYALTSGVYRSTDAGLTWTLLPARGRLFTSIATAPAGPPGSETPAALYAARWDLVSPSAVMCSTDQGATWTALRRGLDSYSPTRVEVDPTDPRRLYLGTSERGLMTYTIP